MIRLIIVVIIVILTTALGAFLALNPGHASFEFLGTQMEMPFVVAAGALILLSFVMLVLWWGIYMLWTSPDKVKSFMSHRRREQGYDALERALIASAAGDGEAAVRQAARADALLDRPALSRLLAARAAEAAGHPERAETQYEALLEDPRTRVVARRGLTQLAHDRGDLEATAEHAADAFDKAKGARWAFDALFDAQVAQGRWDAALETLGEGDRRKHIVPNNSKRRRAVLLTASALASEASDTDRARDLSEAACRAAPGFAPAASLASRLLTAGRKYKKASDVLEASWTLAPHPAIARAYRDLRKSDTKVKRLERLKGLAALQPEHRESKLVLIDVALEDSDAATARTLITPLIADGPPSSRLCALAARLGRLEGEDEQARRWMARAAHASTEADWSDMDPDGRAFPYTSDDWKRMVYIYGDEGRLIHPRYERYERNAEAVPETALLEAPHKRGPAKPAAYFEAPRPPDDPGVDDDDEDSGRAA